MAGRIKRREQRRRLSTTEYDLAVLAKIAARGSVSRPTEEQSPDAPLGRRSTAA